MLFYFLHIPIESKTCISCFPLTNTEGTCRSKWPLKTPKCFRYTTCYCFLNHIQLFVTKPLGKKESRDSAPPGTVWIENATCRSDGSHRKVAAWDEWTSWWELPEHCQVWERLNSHLEMECVVYPKLQPAMCLLQFAKDPSTKVI